MMERDGEVKSAIMAAQKVLRLTRRPRRPGKAMRETRKFTQFLTQFTFQEFKSLILQRITS
jgi:hypothetical protein